MDYGVLSIVPPIITIALAIWTKQVVLSLLLGIWLSFVVISGGNVFGSITSTFGAIFNVFSSVDNLKVIFFDLLIGGFIVLIQASGGVQAIIDYLTEKTKTIRTRKAACLLSYGIGIVNFVDGYLSIILSGIPVRPITDKLRVSREMLAYICDSTSAPINGLIPLSSWGAYLIGLIGAQIAAGVISGNATELLIRSIPLQFYCIMAVVLVGYFILTDRHWGPMKRAEQRVRETGQLLREGARPVVSKEATDVKMKEGLRPDAWNFLVPFAVLLVTIFVTMLVTGKGNFTRGDGTTAIFYGVLMSLAVSAVFYRIRKVMGLSEFMDYLFQGMASMMTLAVLLVLAFAIGPVIKQLGAGHYLATLAQGSVSGALVPAIVFLIGCVMSFCTGTSWGTFGMMMPIALPMAATMGANIPLTIGAVISGGIFGDHCSPLSDTTILSAMAAATDLYDHTTTQVPYALVAGGIALVMYVVAGLLL